MLGRANAPQTRSDQRAQNELGGARAHPVGHARKIRRTPSPAEGRRPLSIAEGAVQRIGKPGAIDRDDFIYNGVRGPGEWLAEEAAAEPKSGKNVAQFRTFAKSS